MQTGRDLQAALKEKIPTKIDIGPVYTQDPARRAAYKGDTSASGFKPVQRELVFDIDLTDYDDVRNSSSGTGMSRKCWVLMRIAIEVRHRHLSHCSNLIKKHFQGPFLIFRGTDMCNSRHSCKAPRWCA